MKPIVTFLIQLVSYMYHIEKCQVYIVHNPISDITTKIKYAHTDQADSLS